MRNNHRIGRLLGVTFILLVGAIAMTDEASPWQASELGETGIFPFDTAPFPHESRAEGHTYNGTHFPADVHYSDNSVALFIPRGYAPGSTVDLVYYWHGWNNNIRKAMDGFRLREQVVGAGKNVILVFPEGPKDASDSHGGRLEEDGALAALTADVMAKLAAEEKIPADATLGRVILSGHSGAYRTMAHCVDHGGLEDHIAEVFLLDASYALLENFANWLQRRPEARLRSIYTAHLAEDNTELMAMLNERGVAYARYEDGDNWQAALADHRVLFLHTTTRDHNGAVEVFEPWLAASGLDPIAE